jgi:hypothetical protein
MRCSLMYCGWWCFVVVIFKELEVFSIGSETRVTSNKRVQFTARFCKLGETVSSD